MDVLGQMELLEETGITRTAAIAQVCGEFGVKRSALFEWDQAHPLSSLATTGWRTLRPQRRGGGAEAEIPEDLWDDLYQRFSAP